MWKQQLSLWLNFRCIYQAKGLFHTSPGQNPGCIATTWTAGQRPASSIPFSNNHALALEKMSRPFRACTHSICAEPRALPWAGMKQAFGLLLEFGPFVGVFVVHFVGYFVENGPVACLRMKNSAA